MASSVGLILVAGLLVATAAVPANPAGPPYVPTEDVHAQATSQPPAEPSVSIPSMMEDPGYFGPGVPPREEVVPREPPSESGSHPDFASTDSPHITSFIHPMCVGSPGSEYHHQALYVYPNDGTNNYDARRAAMRDALTALNGELRDESAEYWGRIVDFRFRCSLNTPSITAVQSTLNQNQITFNTLKDNLRSLGYNGAFARYVVFFDGSGNCGNCVGTGDVIDDPSASINNYHNQGNHFAVVWNDFSWTNVLHEILHTHGAVQLNAPHNADGFHCDQGSDYLCGQPNTFCTGITRIDCLRDDYYNITPSCGTNYLCNNWNMGHTRNRFIWIQNDCGIGYDAGATFGTATHITNHRNNCTGAISHAENSGQWSDYYRFDVSAGGNIHLWMDPNFQADYELRLFNPSGQQVGYSNNGGDGVSEGIDITNTVSGQYRAAITVPYEATQSGTYRFTACWNC